MSELRKNIAINEWVIIATERAKRPEDFCVERKFADLNLEEYSEECPFCPGNEVKTPPEVFRIEDKGKWKVRVIPNKFAAVSNQFSLERNFSEYAPRMTGFGYHEVIIETPKHNCFLDMQDMTGVKRVVETYVQRYRVLKKDRRIGYIVVFKNHGQLAGTSLIHPHSQIVALPIIPMNIRYRIEEAMRYFDSYGSCVFCNMIREEQKAKNRIILQTKSFITFIPYAAFSPFHTWILPLRHMSCFDQLAEEDIEELSEHLLFFLKKLSKGLNNPDYNLVIRSAPTDFQDTKFLHWYIAIVPRLTKIAGFELGSGIFINTALPEESAEFLRNIKL